MRKLSAFIPERTRATEPKTRPISVRLEHAIVDDLDMLAEIHGTTRRGVIQALVVREAEAQVG